MLLKTSLGSAYIHNIDLIDKSTEPLSFIVTKDKAYLKMIAKKYGKKGKRKIL